MPTIGFAKINGGPEEAVEFVLKKLKEKGHEITFHRHHWAGDMPFGLVIVETNKGKVAVRWYLGDEFTFRLEEVSDEAFEDFIDETLDYIGGD
ncbi:hypothetical protein A3L04_07060 [Thermococcus chitonophagus]|uniref:Uncharacterized protein n=1 Tax=Thermococcus chitonophagus TaxID=54262 RepID=A0A160VUM5_9EURY|nr:hypothetical protein [Thermococcus chitonophagus]ASJ16848.1 hypothetical protein A3L04_07060 [Thermococcus chitonophagus]CUX78326.1 hypothetical protein CHITON_1547 [Thermococcus chitonophagus]